MKILIGSLSLLLALSFGVIAVGQSSNTAPSLPVEYVNKMNWRNIGPANMSGRIPAIAVYEKDPSMWWAASASGGLLKTVNNGITFEFQFDKEAVVSVGDVQVAQSDPNIVWVGTGEANPRNSVSWGDGVYKSTDGGKTWKNMGLKKIFQTGRIAIHPTDPNVVYVGALGRLWGPSEDRGLYKTVDGGKTWKKILYIDDKTGVIDVQMDQSNPDRLYVATYERKRDGFDGNDPEVKYGENAGIYRTDDAGENFKELENGLPTCKMGRIGLSIYRKDSSHVYAIVESEKIGKMPEDLAYAGLSGASADEIGSKITAVTKDGPSEKAGLKVGDLVISANGMIVHKYDDLLKMIRNSKVGDELKLTCSRDKKTVEVTIKMAERPKPAAATEGATAGSSARPTPQSRGGRGQSTRNEFTGTLGGQAGNRQDFQGPNGKEYGGIYLSKDHGDTWTRINSLNPRPMYYSQIRVDPSDNNYIYVCGTSLYKSKDGGATFTGDGGSDGIHVDHHSLWLDPNDGRHMILGNDGGIHVTYDRMTHWDHLAHVAIGQFYHVGISSDLDYYVYGGLQDNGSWGGPSRSPDGGAINSDWIRVGGGDGFICLVDPEDPNQIYTESQNGSMGRINLETGERGFIRPRAPSGVRYRFNWKTPFILSPHNSKIHYSAGNHVFRSPYKGDKIKRISPEITNTDKGAGSAISESAVEEGVLYVGTTDGALWASRDGGVNWVNLFTEPEKIARKDDKKLEITPNSVGGGAAQGGSAGGRSAGAGQRGAQGRGGRGGAGAGGGRGAGRFREMLLSRDANKDGKISKDEVPEQMLRIFDRLDSNKDDVIDEKEMAAMGGGRGGASGGANPPASDDSEASDEKAEPKKDDDSEKKSEEKSEEKKSDDKQEEKKSDEKAEAKPAEKKPDDKKSDDKKDAPKDPVSGEWVGKFVNSDFPGEFTLKLKYADKKVTGSYESERADGEITSGTLEGSKVTLIGATGAELKFQAEISGDKMKGSLDVNDGQFTVDFEATKKTTSSAKSGAATTAAAKPAAVPGKSIKDLVPGPRWVSSLEASKFQAGRCYMTLDGHRSNDDAPYVFKTENYGQTWTSILANVPATAGSARVIREDVINRNLLFLGCEFSCWVSIDRGESWTKLNSNLPTVSVHEFAIHPTRGEVVAATHGRSLWILDINGLRQLSKESMAADATLYETADSINWAAGKSRGSSGTRRFVGENPSSSIPVYYSLGKDARSVKLSISNLAGDTIYSATGISGSRPEDSTETVIESGTRKGLHVFNWNGSQQSTQQQRGNRRSRRVPAGNYLLTLTVDGNTFKQTITIKNDPNASSSATTEEELEFMKAMSGVEDEEGQYEAVQSIVD